MISFFIKTMVFTLSFSLICGTQGIRRESNHNSLISQSCRRLSSRYCDWLPDKTARSPRVSGKLSMIELVRSSRFISTFFNSFNHSEELIFDLLPRFHAPFLSRNPTPSTSHHFFLSIRVAARICLFITRLSTLFLPLLLARCSLCFHYANYDSQQFSVSEY